MATTAASTNLTPKQWDAKFFQEYVQANRFARYFGTNENSMIHVKEDLTKSKGDAIHYALVNRLTGAANDGTSKLEGNEEALDSRAHRLTVDLVRNAVTVREFDEQKSSIDLRNAAKSSLKTWSMELLRDDIIDAISEIKTGIGSKVAYASATENQKDVWLDNNYDRILFGDAKSNTDSAGGGGSGYDFSDSLTAITAGMTLSTDIISLARRMALTPRSGSPKVKPITVDGDEQWYVMFAHPLAMRDLKADSAFLQANREARARGKDNPLFRDSDYVWDGVIIREVADLDYLSNVGAGGTVDVAVNALCGAQAFGIGWAARTKSTTKKETDYGNEFGCGIREIRGVDKLCFEVGSADSDEWVQNGIVSVYTAAASD